MSAVVLAIAAVPAATVVAVAVLTRDRLKTSLAAVGAALLGAFTGNPGYMALDVGLVALATYLAWPPLDPAGIKAKAEARAARQAYYESPEYKAKKFQRMTVFTTSALACFLLYLFYRQLTPATR